VAISPTAVVDAEKPDTSPAGGADAGKPVSGL
jgi:hypothetical protein